MGLPVPNMKLTGPLTREHTGRLLEKVGMAEQLDRFRLALDSYRRLNDRRFLEAPEYLWIIYLLGWRPHAEAESSTGPGERGTQEEGAECAGEPSPPERTG